jgi:hypothetical protein
MNTNRYTTNPITGRRIRVGGITFNQLVMDAYDYIDNGLVRRATAPPLPAERESYLNTETGRMVQWGTRTYYFLIQHEGYEIVEDYYLVHPRYAEVAQRNLSILHIQNTQVRIEHLERARIQERAQERERDEAVLLELDRFLNAVEQDSEQRQRERDARQQEAQLARLADLNLALCQECQFPIKLDELPENGLCEDCNKEI